MSTSGLTRRLGPAQSPVVSATITRKRNEARAASSIKRAGFSILIAFLLFTHCIFFFSASLLSKSSGRFILLKYAEIGLAIMLTLNSIYNVTLYVSTHFFKKAIPLAPSQFKMLGIKYPSPGYDLVSEPIPFGEPVSSTPVHDHTPIHPQYYMTPMSSSSNQSFTDSTTPLSSSCSSSHIPTPSRYHSRSSLNSQCKFSLNEESVADAHSLERYLQQEEEQQWLSKSSVDLSSSQSSPPRWYNDGRLSTPSPSLRTYHIAPRRSSSPSSTQSGERDSSYSYTSLGIQKAELDRWTERCRKWIALTIIKPLANEINSINSTFSRKGRSEQIGLVSVSSLKRIASSKAEDFNTLPSVIPYLEISANQDYLVKRIKELAQGSYLSAYRWNAGGTWKGRAWSIELPNDSQVVMHLLGVYLDVHLPPDPWFPNGKTFSTQYFLKAPLKKDATKQGVCIVQDSNISPPVYKVMSSGTMFDVAEGRNNLFHSICIFLHHVKEKEKSMLGSINLETAGVNILSIISPIC